MTARSHLYASRYKGRAVLAIVVALTFVLTACSGDARDIFGTPSPSPLTGFQPSTETPTNATPTAVVVPSPTTLFPTRTATAVVPAPTLPLRPIPTRVIRTPTPTATTVATPIPALETMEIYANGAFRNGYTTISLASPPPDPEFRGRMYLNDPSLQKNLFISNNTGEFMSVFTSGEMDLTPYTHVRLMATSISGAGSWISVSLASQPWQAGHGSVSIYIPTGKWFTFEIPIDQLDPLDTTATIRGIGLRGENSPGARNENNSVAFGEISLVKLPDLHAPRVVSVNDAAATLLNIEFNDKTANLGVSSFSIASQSDPSYSSGRMPASVSTFEDGRFAWIELDQPLQNGMSYTLSVSGVSDSAGNVHPPTTHVIRVDVKPVTLTVNAAKDIHPFTSKNQGVAMQTTSWIWGEIRDPDSPHRAALLDATRRINPGVIRFAGGLWSNVTGWDRANIAPDDGNWVTVDELAGIVYNYSHAYKPAMIDSYAAFASELGAETIIQVNICDNNPSMWADLVRYTNVENDYDFQYWELGDRIDLNECLNNFEYAERFAVYEAALKAVDTTIKVIGPSPTSPNRSQWLNTLSGLRGENLDVLSFQWFQLYGWSDNTSSFDFENGSIDALLNYNTAVGFGCWTGFGCGSGPIQSSDIDRMLFRRGIAESASDQYFDSFKALNSNGETAITGFGPHISQPQNPINGNHLAAIWMADMMPRWAYNGLDIMVYTNLETGSTGKGHSVGLLGIDELDVFDVRPTYYTRWLYAQHFGDMMVESTTSDSLKEIVVWASRDSDDPNVLKLMLVNLSGERTNATLNIAGFVPTSGDAYVMTSKTPASLSNPQSFTEHSTSINGVDLPDVMVASPKIFTDAIDSITPATVSVDQDFIYELPPYSVTALTLRK